VIADLCNAAPDVAIAPDPVDSAAYAQAGDDARAAGDIRIAAIAYRKAVALDATNAHAKQAFAELCRDDAAPPDDAALMAAIAKFRAGDLDAASAALTAIASRGGPSAAGAHFFLGLIALRRHDGPSAATELELARLDREYAEAAAPMLRLAHRDGVVAALIVVEPEIDTNPQLLPDTPPPGATTGPRQTDEDLLIVANATVRPTRWLVLRDILAWRDQRELSSLDFLAETAQAGVELEDRANHGAIRYDLDDDLLAGSAYLIAHRGTATFRRDFGAISVSTSYSLRRRNYKQAAQVDFTGWVHAVDTAVTLHASPQLDVDLRLLGTRELTADREFSDFAGGIQVGVRARPDPRVRLNATATLSYARYDAAEPDGELRRDSHAEATADVEVDLGDHVIALAGASIARNDSTVDDFRFWKLVARAGIAIALGGP
jgi:hypothetical protein